MNKERDDNEQRNIEKSSDLSPFESNSTLSFIYKKSERVSCAIYLLTNHLSDQEPIKWDIRSLSLEFLRDIFFLRNHFSDNPLVFENLKYRLSEITSLIDMLYNIGFITETNFNILKTEILNLSKFFKSEYNLINSPNSVFKNDFFEVEMPEPGKISETSPDFDYDPYKKSEDYKEEKDSNPQYKGHNKGHTYKRQTDVKDMSFIKKSTDSAQSQSSERKQKIISFIKDKKDVSVKDIAMFIKDCSEKTLQRDLISLVKAGVLKKMGERRWSRYLLA